MKAGKRHGATGNSKRAKLIGVALSALFFAFAVPAEAQQPAKLPWIGYLAGAGSGPAPAFVEGLRDLGYVDAKSIGIIFRTAESRTERFPDLAAELVRLKLDVIVADTTGIVTALKKATSSIPIVMANSTDPVGAGLVATVARPGGNVTGLTSLTEELGGKQLEILKEIVVGLNRVAILRPTGLANDIFMKQTEPAARALGVRIIPLLIRGPEDFEQAFRSATKEHANGLIDRSGPAVSSADRKRVAALTVKNRLPAISSFASWADNGGLLTYGPDRNAMYRRAALYVDKILKGAKPADLPVEAPTKFELIINIKTAKQIGVAIPQKVLQRADRVIK